jgi:hypothetical protein
MIKGEGAERKLKLNRGVEVLLRNRNNREEPKAFSFKIAKVVSLFSRNFHFSLEFNISKPKY